MPGVAWPYRLGLNRTSCGGSASCLQAFSTIGSSIPWHGLSLSPSSHPSIRALCGNGTALRPYNLLASVALQPLRNCSSKGFPTGAGVRILPGHNPRRHRLSSKGRGGRSLPLRYDARQPYSVLTAVPSGVAGPAGGSGTWHRTSPVALLYHQPWFMSAAPPAG